MQTRLGGSSSLSGSLSMQTRLGGSTSLSGSLSMQTRLGGSTSLSGSLSIQTRLGGSTLGRFPTRLTCLRYRSKLSSSSLEGYDISFLLLFYNTTSRKALFFF
jgi:hypothetical protein